jgi:predicted RNase H-like HicB family nuclease
LWPSAAAIEWCVKAATVAPPRQGTGKMKMKFVVELTYDPEYEGFVADVPKLPGCMSQGKTAEEALQNVREAVVLFLDSPPEGPSPVLTRL